MMPCPQLPVPLLEGFGVEKQCRPCPFSPNPAEGHAPLLCPSCCDCPLGLTLPGSPLPQLPCAILFRMDSCPSEGHMETILLLLSHCPSRLTSQICFPPQHNVLWLQVELLTSGCLEEPSQILYLCYMLILWQKYHSLSLDKYHTSLYM